jgi:hypothetical protein
VFALRSTLIEEEDRIRSFEKFLPPKAVESDEYNVAVVFAVAALRKCSKRKKSEKQTTQ